MSNAHDTNTTKRREHGTTASYVIGYVLSLIFTFIPYYLVVEKAATGNVLVAMILAIAVLQMIIQIVFFLHLGRGPKPFYNIVFFISTVGIILVVVVGSLWIMHHLHYNMTPVTPKDASKKLVEDEGIYQIGGEKTGACQGVHTNHKVIIKNDQVSPAHTVARGCDKLTFINEDDAAHYIMFGSFDQPEAYAGEDMLTVRKGQAKTVVLTELGTHVFHDHHDPKATGDFTVLKAER